MSGSITTNREEASWVVGSPGANLQKITKNALNFGEKAWWTLTQHRLCPTIGDNVLSPVHITSIAGLMVGYDFDVVQSYPERYVIEWWVLM